MDMTSSAARVNARRLIEGPVNNLMAVFPLKHKWAWEILDLMESNTWYPREIDLSLDIKCYKFELTDAERNMYDKALAFLSNLDGIQFNNLIHNIGKHITSPEVSMVISRQAWEEAVHVKSYATMIEAISLDPMEIYMMFERDSLLAAKNEQVMRQSAVLNDEYTPRNFALAVIANIVLEGIYFFSGFLAFYILAKNGKMLASADMIRYIQRDEEGTHLPLFVKMLETLQIENPEIFDTQFWIDADKIVQDGVKLESEWGRYIIKGGVLGATNSIVDNYIMSLANERMNMIGRPRPYPDVKNPVEWVKKFSAVNDSESNFFETKVAAYQVGVALEW
jgi:ribonucleoside-diphosphate reductase beta chain